MTIRANFVRLFTWASTARKPFRKSLKGKALFAPMADALEDRRLMTLNVWIDESNSLYLAADDNVEQSLEVSYQPAVGATPASYTILSNVSIENFTILTNTAIGLDITTTLSDPISGTPGTLTIVETTGTLSFMSLTTGDGRDSIVLGPVPITHYLNTGGGSDQITLATNPELSSFLILEGGSGTDSLAISVNSSTSTTISQDIFGSSPDSTLNLITWFDRGLLSETSQTIYSTDIENVINIISGETADIDVTVNGADGFAYGNLGKTSLQELSTIFISGNSFATSISGYDSNDSLSAFVSSTGFSSSVSIQGTGLPQTNLYGLTPATGVLRLLGLGGDDTIKVASGVENLVQIEVQGGDGNDYLSADATILGGDGNDTLVGGLGNDTLDGGAGDDLFILSPGDDSIIGGPGFNVLSVPTVTGLNNTVGITQNASEPALFVINGLTSNATLTDINQVSVLGSTGNDTLTIAGNATSAVPLLAFLGAGNDTTDAEGASADQSVTVYGESGDDIYHSGPGTDIFFGGDDFDTLTVTDLTINSTDLYDGGTGFNRVGVSFTSGTSLIAAIPSGFEISNTAGTGSTTALNVGALALGSGSSVSISGSNDDNTIRTFDSSSALVPPIAPGELVVTGLPGTITLTGVSAASVIDIHGQGGNDTFQSLGNSDATLNFFGDSGNDRFEVTQESRSANFSGGDGSDQVNVSGTVIGDALIFSASGPNELINYNFEDAGTILDAEILNVESLAGNDAIQVVSIGSGTGLVEFNLSGGDGNDYISAQGLTSGAFNISGGDGNDTIYGADTSAVMVIYGGGGDDAITLGTAETAAYGEAGNDTLNGSSGADTLSGGDGNDLITGGTGADQIDAGSGDDVIVWNIGDGEDQVTGGTGQDELIVNGDSTAGNAFTVDQQSANSILFEVLIAAQVISAGDVEHVSLTGGSGSDTFNIGDLTGTGVTLVDTNFGTDTVADTVSVLGSALDDHIILAGTTTVAEVTGLAWTVRAENMAFSASTLVDGILIDGGRGYDWLLSGVLMDMPVLVTLQGGAGADLFEVNTPTLGDNPNRVTVIASGEMFTDIIQLNNGRNLVIGGSNDIVEINGTENNDTIVLDGVTTPGRVAISVNGLSSSNDLTAFAGVIHINALGGDDTITAGGMTQAASISGGVGNDTINASGMTVTVSLFGEQGDDLIIGGSGDDSIEGGSGWNSLTGGLGDDVLTGGAGTDSFAWNAGDGFDYFTGNGGEDYVLVSGGAGGLNAFEVQRYSTVYWMQYNGDINQGFEADQVPCTNFFAGAGSTATALVQDMTGINISRLEFDFSQAATAAVSVDGSNASDNLLAGVSPYASTLVEISGLSYQFRLIGTPARVSNILTINGLGGDDILKATPAAEAMALITLDGGDGNDTLSADAILLGGAGDDTFIVPSGSNTIDGGLGFNTIQVDGTNGPDTISVTQGVGTVVLSVNGVTSTNTVTNIQLINVSALAGNDTVTLTGTGTIDTYVYAGDGSDSVNATGLAASVSLYGGVGDDSLTGGSGNDYIDGGDGYDRISGGLGDDFIEGGSGSDHIFWFDGDGFDEIDGGAGDNMLSVIGSTNAANSFNVFVDPGLPIGFNVRVNAPNSGLNTAAIQGLELIGGNLVDSVLVGELTGSSLRDLSILLGGDSVFGDSVVLNGSNGNDILGVSGSGSTVNVSGLPFTVAITGYSVDPAGAQVDTIQINGNAGFDTLFANAALVQPVGVILDGGIGNDLLYSEAPNFAGQSPSLFRVSLIGGIGFDQFTPTAGQVALNGSGPDILHLDGSDEANILNVSQTGSVLTYELDSFTTLIDMSAFTGLLNINANGGNDVVSLSGYTLPSTVLGGDGDDLINASGVGVSMSLYGGNGNDTFRAGSGDDYMEGNDGADEIYCSAGNDQIFGGADSDTFLWNYLLDGNDTIDGGTGQNSIQVLGNANGGNQYTINPSTSAPLFAEITGATSLGLLLGNILTTSIQQVSMTGGSGEDTFTVGDLTGTAVTIVTADFGTDTVADHVSVVGDALNNSIRVTGTSPALVEGLPWLVKVTNAAMNGSLLVDGILVDGGAGDDTIFSSAALLAPVLVTIQGGVGFDDLRTGTGVMGVNPVRVTIHAGATDIYSDTIQLFQGRNKVIGSANDMILVAGSSSNDAISINQTIEGTVFNVNGINTSTNDLSEFEGVIHVDLLGGNDSATLIGYSIPTSVIGGDGNDLVNAEGLLASVTISGGSGNDTLRGTAFADEISGDSGNDDIYGGTGNDTLTGGDGNDDFIWLAGDGLDLIDGGDGDDWAGFSGSTTADNAFTLTPLTSSTPSTAPGLGSGDANRVLVSYSSAQAAHIGDVEAVSLNGGGGCDTFGIGNLQTTDLRVVDVAFSTTAMGGVVSTYATNLPDTITVTADAPNQIGVNGLAVPVRIFNANPATAIVVHAGFGADTIEVDPVAETQAIIVIDGGSGNDTITGGSIIIGGSGNNLLIGTDNPNTIVGGTGSDTIQGLGGSDLLFGDAQVTGLDQPGPNCDYLAGLVITPTATGAGDLIEGGEGDDSINGNIGADSLFGGLGNDEIGELTYKGVFFPESGNDSVDAGEGNNCVFSGDGDDSVVVGNGNNLLVLGTGNDTALTGNGNNTIFAGSGNDSITTGSGNDVVILGAGNDTAKLGSGNDLAWGEDGNDFIIGGLGNDTIYGGNGNDTLWGGTQATKEVKNSSQVVTTPNDGNDVLAGEGGFDKLDGGTANNIMDAGADNIRETMIGSGGWDTAYIHANEGKNQDVLKNHTSRYTLIPYGSMPIAMVPVTPANCDTPISVVIPNPLSGKLAKAPVKPKALPKAARFSTKKTPMIK